MIASAPPAEGTPGNRRWPFWLAIGLVVASVLILIALQSYQALNRAPRTALRQSLVAHSFEVTLTLEALRSAVQDAERGQRGYLLTGSAAYLDPYREATQRIPRLLARLRQLSAQDYARHTQIEQLDGNVERKLAELQTTLAAYRTGGLDAADRIVRTNAGFDEMRAIERQIDGLIDTEERTLTRHLARLSEADQTMQGIAMVSTLLVSILMLAGLALAVASVRSSRRLQAVLARQAEAVTKTNGELAQRNVELARAGELASQAREEARRAEQTKGRFLATASHDLRQPLQTVALLNGVLRRTLRETDAAAALKQQDEAIAAMSRLLNALLDISKLESGTIKPQPEDFPAESLLAAMEQEFCGVAKAKGLQFHIERSDAYIRTDRSLVEQILRNLISNAIKYTRAGEVRVRVRSDPSGVRIDVLDSGIGIAPDQIPMIGEEFYQIGVPSNSTREGYGLGLSIVQRLVKLLDLKLDVESQIGRGSTFSLRLPQGARRAAAAQGGAAEPERGERRGGGESILLVEDDTAVRNATRLLLRAAGYRVVAVAGLAEAMERAGESSAIDLLVTDYHLAGGETGVQVLCRLRAALKFPLKAILITGDTSSAIREVTQDPALRVVSKPVHAEQLLGLVQELLTV